MKTNLRKLYNSKAFWFIISLVCSLVIWVYVSSVETEEFKQTFRGVQVHLAGETLLRDSRNLVITDLDTSTVTIEVVGPRRIVAGINPDQLYVQVDVSRLSRPAFTSQQYAVIFPDGTDTSNLTVTRKTPETINFMVSSMTSKSIQVRGSFDGSVAEGYTAESAVFEPSTITIYGPEAYLRNVDHAWVSFGKENIDSTFEVETGFVLRAADESPCSTTGITFSTDVVTARLPLLTLKDVKLDVNLIEGGGATLENTKVTIEPETITLAGDSKLLGGMNKISLATIDLTDFKTSFTETYTIPIDNELKNITGVTEAKVTVEIVGLESKVFRVSNLSFVNLTEGFVGEILTGSFSVTLRGAPEKLEQVRDENLRAVADLTDVKESTGIYMIKAKIYVDGFPDVGALRVNGADYTIAMRITLLSEVETGQAGETGTAPAREGEGP